MERQFFVLTLFATLSTMSSLMILPYIPLYGREIGMPLSLVGYLIFFYYGSEAVVRISVGSLADFVGYDIMVVFEGLALFGSSVFYLFSMDSWFMLLVGQVLLAVGLSVTWVVIPSYVSKVKDSKESLPWYTFSLGVGLLFGAPLGGFIRDTWGMFRLFEVFLVVSIVMIIISIIFYIYVDEDVISDDKRGSYSFSFLLGSLINSYEESFSILFNNKRVLLASGISFMMFMTVGMSNSLLPIYLSNLGLSSFLIGLLQTARVTSSTLVRTQSQEIVDYLNVSSTLILSISVTGLAIILISSTSFLTIIVLLSVLWGVGGGLYLPVVFNTIAIHSTVENRDYAMGVRGSLSTVGAAIGVIVFSNLANSSSVAFSLKIFGFVIMLFSVVVIPFRNDL